MADFNSFNLLAPILSAVEKQGYKVPTPIQEQAIPHLLEGKDLLGIAQTGTGKTAAFALPILNRLSKTRVKTRPGRVRTLILTPTRELASQIEANFQTYGVGSRISSKVIFGGVGYRPQIQAMSRGVDVLVATPGRLLDLMNDGHVRYDQLEVFVLDEADRMLDMGFIRDIEKVIAKLPKVKQTLLFSATMPTGIAKLATGLLKDPVKVEVTPQATTVEKIDQKVHFVEKSNKILLLKSILKNRSLKSVLVFTRTKHGADRVVKQLAKESISAAAIHGNKSQGARERALGNFRSGMVRVLVATDIAARGIDVPHVSHVINFDLPFEPESYVHRIGRTARAG
ncbi:MAG: DEAD/DEAH box helicase, partial [Halobacteriovoraceae bacterium]|nr:DEAD/DEAH box helicase [Halobacteriovoraceae bacterium]